MSSARLRPVFVALSAVILASATVAPAIALSPAGSRSIATAQTSASPAFLALTRVVASASAQATIAFPARAIASVPAKPKIAASTVAKPVKPSKAPPSITFRGTNHVWIPALGISRAISTFACSRQQAPANYVYRWGCAGTNNVYLLGHAYGVFKALHDAYSNGRLKVGLTAIYANASGTIHTYRVAWWRVVKPTTAAKWAWASLGAPSMTLQTCLGAQSEYRLMVRLVQVH
jgi:Sortase domain